MRVCSLPSATGLRSMPTRKTLATSPSPNSVLPIATRSFRSISKRETVRSVRLQADLAGPAKAGHYVQWRWLMLVRHVVVRGDGQQMPPDDLLNDNGRFLLQHCVR